MNSFRQIETIVRPTRLWLVWQPGPGAAGRRYVVAEIIQEDAGALLRYLRNTKDFAEARAAGFQGYPAFKLEIIEHREGVLDVLMKRIPPATRSDFPIYLERYRLPVGQNLSPFTLLGYTTAKLPGDGFSLLMDLADAVPPIDLPMELAGSRHYLRSEADWAWLHDYTAELLFKSEPGNLQDPYAVAVYADQLKIGYVNRVYAPFFRDWLEARRVSARIDRINGTVDRRLIHIFAGIR